MIHPFPFGSSVPLAELGEINSIYLGSTRTPADPIIVWGSPVYVEALDQFVRVQSQATNTFVTHAHVLLKAVSIAFQKHPEFNRRVLRRRAITLKHINLVMPMLQTQSGEVDYLFLQDTEKMTLSDVSRRVIQEAHQLAASRCRAATSDRASWTQRMGEALRRHWVHRMCRVGFAVSNRIRLPNVGFNDVFNSASALVNHFNYSSCPPMSCFKPSCLGMNSCHVNVTLGPAQPQPVVVDGEVVIRRVATIYVRGDHRLIDTRNLAAFIGTIRQLLETPQLLLAVDETRPDRRPQQPALEGNIHAS